MNELAIAPPRHPRRRVMIAYANDSNYVKRYEPYRVLTYANDQLYAHCKTHWTWETTIKRGIDTVRGRGDTCLEEKIYHANVRCAEFNADLLLFYRRCTRRRGTSRFVFLFFCVLSPYLRLCYRWFTIATNWRSRDPLFFFISFRENS